MVRRDIMMMMMMMMGTFREVEYNIYNENQTVADTRRGRLFPNVKGCGYPPIVECDGKKQHF